MEDEELQAIRQRRLQQLQQGARGDGPQANPEEITKRNAEADLMKNTILTQALDQDALARLSNLQVAKPDKARQIEELIIRTVRMGQLRGKMRDEQFRDLLNQISEKSAKTTTTVKFDRRRAAIDSDSD